MHAVAAAGAHGRTPNPEQGRSALTEKSTPNQRHKMGDRFEKSSKSKHKRSKGKSKDKGKDTMQDETNQAKLSVKEADMVAAVIGSDGADVFAKATELYMLQSEMLDKLDLARVKGEQGEGEEADEVVDEKKGGKRKRANSSIAMSSLKKELRDHIYTTMTDGNYSRLALFYQALMFLFIIWSIVNLLLETLPEYYAADLPSFFTMELLIVIVFTIDYLVRLVLTRDSRRKWVMEFLNIVDLVSVLPFYIELIVVAAQPADGAMSSTYGSAFSAIRVLRLFRIIRLFKTAKWSKEMVVMIETLQQSESGFVMLALAVGVATLVFGATAFFAENLMHCTFVEGDGAWKPNDCVEEFGSAECTDLCDFQDVFDSMWWAVVTLTTVGYGDKYPRSWLGRVVGAATVLIGLLVLAFPITVIGANFEKVWQQHTKDHDLLADDSKVRSKESRMKPDEILYAMRDELRVMGAQIDGVQALIDNTGRNWNTMVRQLDTLLDREELPRDPALGRKRDRLMSLGSRHRHDTNSGRFSQIEMSEKASA